MLQASTLAASVLVTEPEQALLTAVEALGYPAAIFPGDEPSRRTIDSSIAALEAASPTPSPLQQPEHDGAPAPLLLDEWELIYASSGTYLTRSGGAQVLLSASALPGVGVSGIRQGLQLAGSGAGSSKGSSSSSSSGQPQLRTSNAATLGLGPFGDWEIVVEGVWAVRDGQLARVSFDGFSLQLVGLFDAIKLPRMAKVRCGWCSMRRGCCNGGGPGLGSRSRERAMRSHAADELTPLPATLPSHRPCAGKHSNPEQQVSRFLHHLPQPGPAGGARQHWQSVPLPPLAASGGVGGMS